MSLSYFPLPSYEKRYTIYTKQACTYCRKIKELLAEEKPVPIYISVDDILENQKEDFLAFIERKTGIPHRTFPMVFYEGKFIGGYIETLRRREMERMLLKENVIF